MWVVYAVIALKILGCVYKYVHKKLEMYLHVREITYDDITLIQEKTELRSG